MARHVVSRQSVSTSVAVGVVAAAVFGGHAAGVDALAVKLQPRQQDHSGPSFVHQHGAHFVGLHGALRVDQPGADAHRDDDSAELWLVAIRAAGGDPSAGTRADPADGSVVCGAAVHHSRWR